MKQALVLAALFLIQHNAFAALPETLSVQSTEPNPIYATTSLTAGNTYLLEASGTYSWGGGSPYFGDAGYLTDDSWVTLRTDVGIRATTSPGDPFGTEPAIGAGALLVDFGSGPEVIDWGDYTSDHIYQYSFVAATDSIGFVIGDWWGDWNDGLCEYQSCMFDNIGSLSVTLSDVSPVPLPATAWLLLTAIGGLFGVSRYNKRKQA